MLSEKKWRFYRDAGMASALVFVVLSVLWAIWSIDAQDLNLGWWAIGACALTTHLLGSFNREWAKRSQAYEKNMQVSRVLGATELRKLVVSAHTAFCDRLATTEKQNPVSEANALLDLLEVYICLTQDVSWVEKLQMPGLVTLKVLKAPLSGTPTTVVLSWKVFAAGLTDHPAYTFQRSLI